ncbi:MAG: MlaD family protein [Planctomycetota bacterium]
MRRTTRDAMIGLTAIGGLVVLAWMLLRFGELAGVGEEFETIVLRVDSARGVSAVSPVSLNGVRVGDVTEIRLAGDGSRQVLIELRMREGTGLSAPFEARVDANFVGVSVVDLTPVEGVEGTPIRGEGEEYPVDLISLRQTLTDEVLERIGTFEDTREEFVTLMRTYKDLGDRLTESVQGDEKSATGLEPTLERFNRAIERFDSSAEAISQDTRAIRLRAEATLDTADATLRSIDGAAAQVEAIAQGIRAGEGTLGQLATNPDLYDALTATAEQLRQLVRDARLLIEKTRDEGFDFF